MLGASASAGASVSAGAVAVAVAVVIVVVVVVVVVVLVVVVVWFFVISLAVYVRVARCFLGGCRLVALRLNGCCLLVPLVLCSSFVLRACCFFFDPLSACVLDVWFVSRWSALTGCVFVGRCPFFVVVRLLESHVGGPIYSVSSEFISTIVA